MSNKLTAAWIAVLVLLSSPAISQSLRPISLDTKIQKASLIVEGKVVSQKSFWNQAHTVILTSNTIEVFKVFKGELHTDSIEVITVGGTVDDMHMGATDLLQLKTKDIGILFCEQTPVTMRNPSAKAQGFKVYGSKQGFIKYAPGLRSAGTSFAKYSSIELELYPQLIKKTGQRYRTVKELPLSKSNARESAVTAVGITSFSPATVRAGALLDPTNNRLTITGSGFGTLGTNCAVLFPDADDGGGTYSGVGMGDPLLISWSNTSIQLKVPSSAGTGPIIVQNQAGEQALSATSLVIDFAILTSYFPSVPMTKENNLMNTNGVGGYTIQYSNSTAGNGINIDAAPEKATFQRALATWKEVAGYNVIEGGATSVQSVANDGVNVVTFDNLNTGNPPLDDGVLGVCYYFARACSGGFEVEIDGFDIVIRNDAVSSGSTSFVSGPCPPATTSYADYDLETVLLHELGHSIGLGHIIGDYEGASHPQINPEKLMNFAMPNGVRRISPDRSAYQGALYAIKQQGNSYGSCGLPNTEMIPLTKINESKDECPTFPVTALANNTSVSFDLVHATSNSKVDPQYTALNTSGTGTGITNTAYYAFKTSGTGTSLFLTVSGYGTTPAAVASCPLNTGVELAIYAVSSCPTGQAYPLPVTYRTFNSNGLVTAVNGLSANTNYLLVADGIENTKANFSLSFSATILPIKITDFSGIMKEQSNEVKWKADFATNIRHLLIQKSIDGTHFETIGKVSSEKEMLQGYFEDHAPYRLTYYRLATEPFSGAKEYSEIISLQRTGAAAITIGPNPASSEIRIQFNEERQRPFSVRVYNNAGQLVLSKENLTGQSHKLHVQNLVSGLYQVVIFEEGRKSFNAKVFVE